MAGPAALSAKDFGNLKGVNVGAASAATDVPQYGQVQSLATAAQNNAQAYTDNALASLASGQTLKGTVRAYTATNVAIAAPGSTIDGLTPAIDDIFWLGGQTTGSQGGPWAWKGASTPMVRPANWDTAAEAVVGSYWIVREGTSADSFVLLTNDSFVLGTTTPVAKLIGIAQAATPDGYSEVCPATAAGSNWTITHGLTLTAPPTVQVFRVAAPGDLMDVAVRCVSPYSQVIIAPDVALAAGEFRAVVKKVV